MLTAQHDLLCVHVWNRSDSSDSPTHSMPLCLLQLGASMLQEPDLTAGGGEQALETGVPDVVLAPGTRRRFRFVEALLPVAPPSAPALEPPAI